MTAPLFSIIIPCYNYEAYVGRAIESVLTQDFTDYDVLVCDDGSSDRSWEIIAGYGDAIAAERGENRGAARTCLSAVKRCRGRYAYILDADDELVPGALAQLAKHVKDNPAKIQFPLQPINERGEEIGPAFPTFADPYPRARMFRELARDGSYRTSPMSGNLFRADLLRAIDDIAYEAYFDGVTYLLAAFAGEVITLYTPLARYRVHANNASSFQTLDPAFIDKQARRFIDRLDHVRALCLKLGLDASLVPDGAQLAFVQERKIMALIARGAPVRGADVIELWRRLWRSANPAKARIALAAWALASCLSPQQWRTTLLMWRYNPWSRPALLRRAVAALH